MRTVLIRLVLLVSVLAGAVGVTGVFAQDAMAEKVACDSTLALLLLVAEHDYDYLSQKLDMGEELPAVDLGQYESFTMSTIAMMQQAASEMTEEQAAQMETMNAMIEPMMAMDAAAILADYDKQVGMETAADMTVLQPGNVAGENELCTTLRADVEHFLVLHLVAESESMMAEGQ